MKRTNSVVAICRELSPIAGSGAVGIPVSATLFNGAIATQAVPLLKNSYWVSVAQYHSPA